MYQIMYKNALTRTTTLKRILIDNKIKVRGDHFNGTEILDFSIIYVCGGSFIFKISYKIGHNSMFPCIIHLSPFEL